MGPWLLGPLAMEVLFSTGTNRQAETIRMLKLLIVGSASLAFVGTAVAADMPRPQPVVQTGPIGKFPVGKYPVGKYPVGKTPVGKYPTPIVTKG